MIREFAHIVATRQRYNKIDKVVLRNIQDDLMNLLKQQQQCISFHFHVPYKYDLKVERAGKQKFARKLVPRFSNGAQRRFLVE